MASSGVAETRHTRLIRQWMYSISLAIPCLLRHTKAADTTTCEGLIKLDAQIDIPPSVWISLVARNEFDLRKSLISPDDVGWISEMIV
jgi:hypothetical protein